VRRAKRAVTENRCYVAYDPASTHLGGGVQLLILVIGDPPPRPFNDRTLSLRFSEPICSTLGKDHSNGVSRIEEMTIPESWPRAQESPQG